MRTAVAVGVFSAASTAVLAALLANAYRCIDTPTFYTLSTLVLAAFGAGVLGSGAALVGARRHTLGLSVLLVGLLVFSYAVAAPPYRTCGQFFMPL